VHTLPPHVTILATGGYGRTYFTCTRRTPAPVTAMPWCCAPACRCRTWSSCISPHRHLRRGCLITEGARVRAVSHQLKGRALHGRYAPNAKDLASRDVVSRAMTVEIREGAGVGPEHDYIVSAPGAPGGRCHSRTPAGIRRLRAYSPRRRHPRAIPVQPTVHYNMGGIPCNYRGDSGAAEGRRSGQHRPRAHGGRGGGLRVVHGANA